MFLLSWLHLVTNHVFLEHPSEATAHLREATSGEVEVLKLFNGLMGRWHWGVWTSKKMFKKKQVWVEHIYIHLHVHGFLKLENVVLGCFGHICGYIYIHILIILYWLNTHEWFGNVSAVVVFITNDEALGMSLAVRLEPWRVVPDWFYPLVN